MAGPSNIRVNPFTGTGGATNYVELTEKHIIPAVSPYVIRLNEVPEKQDPSNMKMVYVDSATGAATENALTEVAATPGQGEFRPDYSTNAMEDKTWNTGLIEFSASDAGKIVQVTYTGTGTLAGVTSNHWPSWWTDRGDGSDGDFVPTENTTISDLKQYSSVYIKEGITVTVERYAAMKCLGSVVIEGTITADGTGGVGGKGQDKSYGLPGEDGNFPGGVGGHSSNNPGAGGAGTKYNKDYLRKGFQLIGAGGGGGGASGNSGSWGGNGGNGGGCIYIIAKEVRIGTSGKISSNGLDGKVNADKDTGAGAWTGGGGGGAGGLIAIIADSISNDGSISVSGGKPGQNTYVGTAGSDGLKFLKQLGAL